MSIAGALGWRSIPVVASLAVALYPFPQQRIGGSGPSTSIAITSPLQDEAIAGSVVTLKLSGGPPANAYIYVTVDRQPPASGGTIDVTAVRSTSSTVHVPITRAGSHRLFAVFGDAGRVRSGTAVDDVSVSVAGPFLSASALKTAVEGDPWTIKVAVPAAHPLARTGRGTRLAFILDGDLPGLGQRVGSDVEGVVVTNIPTVPFTGLEAGDHHVWVLLVDGGDVPLEPYLATFVTVRITA